MRIEEHEGEYEAETVISVLLGRAIAMEVRLKALEELLMETRLISEREIVEKCMLVMDRDGGKLNDEIFKMLINVEETTANESR